MKKIHNWSQVNRVKLLYSFILGLVFIIFLILVILNIEVKKKNPELNINDNPISYAPAEFPKLNNLIAPYITAQGAVVMDRDSQVVLFEKNQNIRFSPASTTKIMTALVAFEQFMLNDELTVFKEDVEGSVIGLSQNEKMTFENLLYAMMLPSANDATVAIAQNYPGGESAFVDRMNQKAKEFGLVNTHFEDPSGLMDESGYTTPLDLIRLSSIAISNPLFAKVVSTKNKSITNTSGKVYSINNLNILLGLPGVNGIKTGFTEEAGQVLVTSKKLPKANKDILIVVMQSLDRFGDSEILLNYLDNNITYSAIHP